ncbi:DNA circularization protein [Pseudogulbenkiania sp. MAI-1]|uniref:DNA circularization protein n=1 Tax=Pseudogulbenkiania sp. MAI-1 TaxID=990370 RepID=UPI00045E87E3|nr:DNA circularization N-terminal domain-containing protein [Pseudogulbenkiania sp. MAI-1]
MAWKDTLLDASFRGVTFDCLRTQDSAQRDTASHEYPYLDGADVEDLGRKARRVAITAVFWGDDYESRLQAFLEVLDQSGPGELIHPVFGSIQHAQLIDYQFGHDADSPDYCTVELNFVQSTPGNPFFVQQLPAQQAEAVNQLTESARFNGIGAFATALEGLKGVKNNLSRLNALRDVLTGTLGVIRSQVQGIITTTLDLIDYPRAFAADVVGLISGIADLRGFDIDVLMSDWQSLVGQLDDVVKLPAGMASGSGAGTTLTSSTNSTSTTMGSVVTQPGGTTSGTSGNGAGTSSSGTGKPIPAKAEDVAMATSLLQLTVAAQLADSASQIFAAEVEEPTLSPPQIEQIAGDVRQMLQAAIEAHRELYGIEDARPVTEALKDTALGVQEAAVALIVQRPPLVTRTVDAPGNLHLVAFRWYGDYTRAQELARLNPQLTNPNALQAGDTLYAYAQ